MNTRYIGSECNSGQAEIVESARGKTRKERDWRATFLSSGWEALDIVEVMEEGARGFAAQLTHPSPSPSPLREWRLRRLHLLSERAFKLTKLAEDFHVVVRIYTSPPERQGDDRVTITKRY